MQEVIQKKRGYIRSLALRSSSPSQDQVFNSYNCAWMHIWFLRLLEDMLKMNATAVPEEVLKDMLVCFRTQLYRMLPV